MLTGGRRKNGQERVEKYGRKGEVEEKRKEGIVKKGQEMGKQWY